ncbi:MAG: STAS domain-containing protein [Acidobacteriota bacterium]
MQCDVSHDGDVAVISLQGRLVAGVGDILLRDSVNELLADERKKILIDLSQVTHIDSSGVGELVASRRIAERFGARLKLVRAKPDAGVDRVLRMAQILPLFQMHEDAESAVSSFGEAAAEADSA